MADGISNNLGAVRDRIARTARLHGRAPESVTLIAVSKAKPATAVAEAHRAGQLDFGENYAQEAAAKIQALAGLPLRWHFIGRVQSNKTALIARHFDWVHTVDRLKIARRLAGHRADGSPLNVLVQVNIDDDPAKGGVAPDAVGALVDAMRGLDGLRLRGLMAVLERAGDAQSSYRRARTLFEGLAGRGGDGWDVLSMGMSGDLEAAIAAGATQVRVGTAIFGPR
ncbi:MAG: YggS family pyridoxal phosphate-dependent enzyme [Gammaproteobacteria bacterium]|nr:YggS family pyridoxal phosphate-dependent enzyme [Gammaproteobacteria bacterium]